METAGTFHCYGAYAGGQIVGFVTLLTPIIPHYGVSVGVTESLFAAKAYRKKGVGLKLLRAAEKHARAAGCPAFMVSAPSGGTLVDVLSGLAYHETNRVFTKVFANG
jgi:GNAT superfamily N-acetyltransferase